MEFKFTDSNFEAEVLKSELPVLVDFYADWCGPCKMVAPIVDELANEYEGVYKVGKLNVDDSPNTSSNYRVMSIPTLLIIKDGQVVDSVVGVVPKAQLAAKLDQHK